MKIGLLGLISSDLSDVDYNKIRWAKDFGFHGVGAHLNVPASTINEQAALNARAAFDANNMPFLQLWGPYPSILSKDENIRRAGVEGARDIVKLAAKIGVPESGVRPTSMNPRFEWGAHPENVKPETEDRLVQSLKEILQTAEDYGIVVVLEAHCMTTLNSATSIKRIIERTESNRLKLNMDLCNFVCDLPTAYDPTPMINEQFDLLAPYIATVHVKDYYLEDRLTLHVTETVIGTGMMDFDTIIRRMHEAQPDGYLVIEHLPLSQIPIAKANLTQKIQALGLPLG
ncbi:MAG: sugar phosphate isomerase/epimerase [Burkholderiales bacterium]|nr:sugar phosphate isomerase/epimerase [Anaerolineae bacterium]